MFVAPVRVVAVVVVIRAMAIVPRRANAYADTTRSRIETNLCRGRQSRADRDRRHKRNSKLPHDCPPVLVALLINVEPRDVVPIVPCRNKSNLHVDSSANLIVPLILGSQFGGLSDDWFFLLLV